jgi:hypothetical protein
MNWKNHVHKQSAKNFVLPAGWDSKEKIAEQLECSPDRVRILLAPGVKSGEIETAVFPVWDNVTKRVNRVTAFRTKPAGAAKAVKKKPGN